MKKMDRILKEWIMIIAAAILLVYGIYQFIWPVRVIGSSMENSLFNNDIVLVNKLNNHDQDFNRGDMIVVNIQISSQKDKVVKRVIGIEGDHVVINNNSVMINGKSLEEPYLSSSTMGEVDLFVPRNGYFILGDNREESKDSRHFGCIEQKDIIGKVIYIMFKDI